MVNIIRWFISDYIHNTLCCCCWFISNQQLRQHMTMLLFGCSSNQQYLWTTMIYYGAVITICMTIVIRWKLTIRGMKFDKLRVWWIIAVVCLIYISRFCAESVLCYVYYQSTLSEKKFSWISSQNQPQSPNKNSLHPLGLCHLITYLFTCK